jgi:type IV secretory pathway protease TraF
MIALYPSERRAHSRSMRNELLLTVLCVATLGCALIAGTPALVYNASPSAPRGFYARRAAAPGLNTYVTVRAGAVAPGYAALRNFNGPRNYFIKRVAASAGDFVCARGDRVDVEGTHYPRLSVDHAGRRLPAWRGCRQLGDDEFFLIGDGADSFDSRYWGPVNRAQIEGVWTHLFAVRSED